MSDPSPAPPQDRVGRVRSWAALVRDVGVIVGIPALIAVGVQLYELQAKAAEAQIKANEAQIKAIEAQNATLRETQYDRALALITSQRQLFDAEREDMKKRLETAEDKARIATQKYEREFDGVKREILALSRDQERLSNLLQEMDKAAKETIDKIR